MASPKIPNVNVKLSQAAAGPPGKGVPAGGAAGQFLRKNSAANYDTGWASVAGGGGGGGPITSADITDATPAGRAILTAADAAAQRADLGLGSAALQTSSAFAAAAHTHTASNVSDFNEAVDDRVAGLLVEGVGIDLTYNDAGGTLTIAATGGGSGSGLTVEEVQDVVGGLLQDSATIDATYNDAGDVETIDVKPNSSQQKVALLNGGTLVGTRQAINLIQGGNVTLTTADNVGADRVDVTIAAAGGSTGGSGSVTAAGITDATTAGRAMLTAADAAAQTALLNSFTTTLKGLTPPSGGGSTNFLRADGTWTAPASGSGGTTLSGTANYVKSFADLGTTTIAGGIDTIEVGGYFAERDCPPFYMKRVASTATAWDGQLKKASADGQHWEFVIVGDEYYCRQVGFIDGGPNDIPFTKLKAYLIAKDNTQACCVWTQGAWRFSETIVMEGGKKWYWRSTSSAKDGALLATLLFDGVNKHGIIIDSYDTLNANAVPGKNSGGATGSRFENLTFWATRYDPGYTGIFCRTRATFKDCVWNGGDIGLFVYGDIAAGNGGNANCGYMENCTFQFAKSAGVRFQGSDGNAWYCFGISVLNCGAIGLAEYSFLGNHFYSMHSEGCGPGTGSGVTPLSPGQATDGSAVYFVVVGREADASTVAPGTDDHVWEYAYSLGGAPPPVSTPRWTTGQTWAPGGPIIMTNSNNRACVFGIYCESGQLAIQTRGRPYISDGGARDGTTFYSRWNSGVIVSDNEYRAKGITLHRNPNGISHKNIDIRFGGYGSYDPLIWEVTANYGANDVRALWSCWWDDGNAAYPSSGVDRLHYSGTTNPGFDNSRVDSMTWGTPYLPGDYNYKVGVGSDILNRAIALNHGFLGTGFTKRKFTESFDNRPFSVAGSLDLNYGRRDIIWNDNVDYGQPIFWIVKKGAAHADGLVLMDGPIIPVPANSAPVNKLAPTISGTLIEGSTLTVAVGEWWGYPDPTFAFQWKRNGTNISGATAKTYVLVGADVGATITNTVTAANAAGSVSSTSAGVGPVIVFTSGPVNTVAPTVTGTAAVGSTLTAAAGTWTGTPTPTVTRQWLRSGVAISGQTGTTYLVASGDNHASISVRESATNSVGTTTKESTPRYIGGVTLDPANKAATITLSNANLTATAGGSAGSRNVVKSTAPLPSTGKWWAAFHFDAKVDGPAVGICSAAASTSPSTYPGNDNNFDVYWATNYHAFNDVGAFGFGNGLIGASAAGDYCVILWDGDNQKAWFAKVSGGVRGNWNGLASDDPATNVGGDNLTTMAGTTRFLCFNGAAGDAVTANFGGSSPPTTIPTGFNALPTT